MTDTDKRLAEARKALQGIQWNDWQDMYRTQAQRIIRMVRKDK